MINILIGLAIAVISYTVGYFTCKNQLGRVIAQAVTNLDKTKVIMVDADEMLKRMKNEICDTTSTEDEEK